MPSRIAKILLEQTECFPNTQIPILKATGIPFGRVSSLCNIYKKNQILTTNIVVYVSLHFCFQVHFHGPQRWPFLGSASNLAPRHINTIMLSLIADIAQPYTYRTSKWMSWTGQHFLRLPSSTSWVSLGDKFDHVYSY